jgi:hypothetical protein
VKTSLLNSQKSPANLRIIAHASPIAEIKDEVFARADKAETVKRLSNIFLDSFCFLFQNCRTDKIQFCRMIPLNHFIFVLANLLLKVIRFGS